MAIRPKTHRASGQLRRSALLKAAADLAGEVGVGAVTHRAVAARAGVPLSTTSYFFASIDELMIEAMRETVNARVAELEAATLGVTQFGGSPMQLARLVAEALVASPHTMDMAEIEVYLAAGRNESLRETVADAMDAFIRFTEAALAAAGAPHPEEMAPIFRALTDGMMLHRVARPRSDDVERLLAGLEALFVATVMSDVERDEYRRRLSEPRVAAPAEGRELA